MRRMPRIWYTLYGNDSSALIRDVVNEMADKDVSVEEAVEGLRGRKGKGAGETKLFRKTANTGAFKGLLEPMQLKNVEKVARDAGIGLDGIKIKIARDPELIGKGVFADIRPLREM